MFFAKALCIKAESLHFNQIKFENYIFKKEDLYSVICLHSWVSLQFSHAVRLNSVFIAQLGDFLSHQSDSALCALTLTLLLLLYISDFLQQISWTKISVFLSCYSMRLLQTHWVKSWTPVSAFFLLILSLAGSWYVGTLACNAKPSLPWI